MWRRALVLLFVVFGIIACKKKVPKAGDACHEEGQFVCATATTKMVCTSGKYRLENCTTCEQTKSFGSSTSFTAGCVAGGIGPEGAACEGESFDCDGSQYVKCVAGQYRHFPCGGAGGCRHILSGVSCDATIATAGAACKKDSEAACTADRKGMLHCKGGVFVQDRSCKGPSGCSIEKKEGDTFSLTCDVSINDVGDPCVDGGSCSTDKHSVLKCDKGKLVPFLRCRGADPSCLQTGDEYRCVDAGLAELGDPCESGGACAPDGKALLTCKDGAFALRSKCKTCKVTGTHLDCKF